MYVQLSAGTWSILYVHSNKLIGHAGISMIILCLYYLFSHMGEDDNTESQKRLLMIEKCLIDGDSKSHRT